jgi:hypothetical protein
MGPSDRHPEGTSAAAHPCGWERFLQPSSGRAPDPGGYIEAQYLAPVKFRRNCSRRPGGDDSRQGVGPFPLTRGSLCEGRSIGDIILAHPISLYCGDLSSSSYVLIIGPSTLLFPHESSKQVRFSQIAGLGPLGGLRAMHLRREREKALGGFISHTCEYDLQLLVYRPLISCCKYFDQPYHETRFAHILAIYNISLFDVSVHGALIRFLGFPKRSSPTGFAVPIWRPTEPFSRRPILSHVLNEHNAHGYAEEILSGDLGLLSISLSPTHIQLRQ